MVAIFLLVFGQDAISLVGMRMEGIDEVAVGAGIGILAAKTAYWIFPWVERNFLPARRKKIDIY